MAVNTDALRAKRYLGYMFRPTSSTRYTADGQEGLHVEGTVCWSLSGTVGAGATAVEDYLAQWDRRGYMMGLVVRKGQRIDRLSYARQGGGDLVMQPSTSAAADLETTLSIPADSEWVVLTSVEGRRQYTLIESNVVAFEVTLRIRPAGQGSQIVPVATRHRDGRFRDTFMPGLWVLPAAR